MEYFDAQERLILCFDSLSHFALGFSAVFRYDSVRLARAAALLAQARVVPRERRLPWGLC